MGYRLKYNKSVVREDNKEPFHFLYFIQLLVAGTGKIHIVIQKITLSTHIVDCMICISMKNNVL